VAFQVRELAGTRLVGLKDCWAFDRLASVEARQLQSSPGEALPCHTSLFLLLLHRQSPRSSRELGRKRRSNDVCRGPSHGFLSSMHTRTCHGAGPVSGAFHAGETFQILTFPRLWPFCVFEIVLWKFGFEGGLSARLVTKVSALVAAVQQL
jgi:hypothetical protein